MALGYHGDIFAAMETVTFPSNTYMYAIFFMFNLILENKNDQR